MNTAQVISRIKLTSIGGSSSYSTFVPVIGSDATYGLNGVFHPSLIPAVTTGNYAVNGNLTVNTSIYTGGGEINWNGSVWQAGLIGALHTIPFDDAVVHLAGSETIPGTKAFSTITASTVNGLTITTTTGTLNIANGKTLKVDNTLELIGTDATAFTFPNTSDTVATLAATQNLTNKTYNGLTLTPSTGTLNVTNAKTLKVDNTLELAGTDSTVFTFPNTSDTVATLAATQNLTNKTYNGLTVNSTTGTLAIANGETLTVNNSLTLSGTDSSTLNIGGGGTLGSNAYTSTSYATAAQLDNIFGVTTGTTFSNIHQYETLYINNTSSTIGSQTIALPSVTVVGRIYAIHTWGAITSLTVTGTMADGSAVTTLAANSTIEYQATNTDGTYLRLR